MNYIRRKSLLYKSKVEYADYTINHVEGCSHGCMYPCYAMMLAKRFGKVKTYEEWCRPKIVENAEELLAYEIPKYKDKIEYVHLCFTTDPFMYGYDEISKLSIRLIKQLNNSHIKCTALTKGTLPLELSELSDENEFGITLVSIDETYREKYEPFSAPASSRIESLYELHKRGIKTWVSIEPYPTPNIIEQDIKDILKPVEFADKIIFGRLNYNSIVSSYKESKEFYNKVSQEVIDYCVKNNKEYHIKNGTIT